MDVCLARWSALECWRRIRALGKKFLAETMELPPMTPLYAMHPSITQKEAEAIAEQYGLSWPLQVAVSDSSFRRTCKYVETKVFNKSDAHEAFIRLEEGLYIETPESIFEQMSSYLDTVDLVRLGYELCSTYALDHLRSGKLVDSFAIATPQSLKAATDACQRAQRALRYVKSDAASPPEVESSIKLGLPCAYGGFNLPGHTLNPELALSDHAQALADKKFCRADLYFAGIDADVEYDSSEWHSGPEKAREDERRRAALRADGHTVIPLTFASMRSAESMTALAKELHRRAGTRLRLRTKGFAEKQTALFARFETASQIERPVAAKPTASAAAASDNNAA